MHTSGRPHTKFTRINLLLFMTGFDNWRVEEMMTYTIRDTQATHWISSKSINKLWVMLIINPANGSLLCIKSKKILSSFLGHTQSACQIPSKSMNTFWVMLVINPAKWSTLKHWDQKLCGCWVVPNIPVKFHPKTVHSFLNHVGNINRLQMLRHQNI